MSINDVVVHNIRMLLLSKGMNYTDLTKAAGLSVSYPTLLKKAESCNPTLNVLAAIADVLRVSVKDLVDEHLNIERLDELPPGLKWRTVMLTEMQMIQIEDWLTANKQKIADFRRKKAARREELRQP